MNVGVVPAGVVRAGVVKAGVVVPVRSFATGKARLAEVLDDPRRVALVRAMAGAVIDAAGDDPVCVVTSDREVERWAAERGAACIPDPGSLDAAAAAGREWARDRGLPRVVVAHADLPHARTLAEVAAGGDTPVASIVADHRRDGTPVLAVPVAADFRFSYGAGSFDRHVAEATRCGLTVRVVVDADLAFDVDVPADLARLPRSGRPAPAASPPSISRRAVR